MLRAWSLQLCIKFPESLQVPILELRFAFIENACIAVQYDPSYRFSLEDLRLFGHSCFCSFLYCIISSACKLR
uniref:Uncharacterized protein n=1 Tax=Physcomitrium patens TaxID=3218 RepID=A0A7I3Z4N2_PHYPA